MKASISILAVALLLLAVAACGSGTTPGATYSGGRSACAAFGNLVADAGKGIVTMPELRDHQAEKVQGRASTAEPEINSAATALLAALTLAKGSATRPSYKPARAA